MGDLDELAEGKAPIPSSATRTPLPPLPELNS